MNTVKTSNIGLDSPAAESDLCAYTLVSIIKDIREEIKSHTIYDDDITNIIVNGTVQDAINFIKDWVETIGGPQEFLQRGIYGTLYKAVMRFHREGLLTERDISIITDVLGISVEDLPLPNQILSGGLFRLVKDDDLENSTGESKRANNIVLIYTGLKKYEEALEKAGDISNENNKHTIEAYLLQKLERFQEADVVFKKQMNLQQDDIGIAEIIAKRGINSFRSEDYTTAINMLLKARNNGLYLGRYNTYIAMCYGYLGKYQKGIEYLKKVIKKDGGQAYTYATLGNLYFSKKQYSLAEKSMKKAIELRSSISVFHYTLGRIMLKQGDAKSAETSFREALRLEPDNKEYQSLVLESKLKPVGGNTPSPVPKKLPWEK